MPDSQWLSGKSVSLVIRRPWFESGLELNFSFFNTDHHVRPELVLPICLSSHSMECYYVGLYINFESLYMSEQSSDSEQIELSIKAQLCTRRECKMFQPQMPCDISWGKVPEGVYVMWHQCHVPHWGKVPEGVYVMWHQCHVLFWGKGSLFVDSLGRSNSTLIMCSCDIISVSVGEIPRVLIRFSIVHVWLRWCNSCVRGEIPRVLIRFSIVWWELKLGYTLILW